MRLVFSTASPSSSSSDCSRCCPRCFLWTLVHQRDLSKGTQANPRPKYHAYGSHMVFILSCQCLSSVSPRSKSCGIEKSTSQSKSCLIRGATASAHDLTSSFDPIQTLQWLFPHPSSPGSPLSLSNIPSNKVCS